MFVSFDVHHGFAREIYPCSSGGFLQIRLFGLHVEQFAIGVHDPGWSVKSFLPGGELDVQVHDYDVQNLLVVVGRLRGHAAHGSSSLPCGE